MKTNKKVKEMLKNCPITIADCYIGGDDYSEIEVTIPTDIPLYTAIIFGDGDFDFLNNG